MRAALYARVSTTDQQTENQLVELRQYAAARGWTVAEYVDHGVSGAKDRRPMLDQLVVDAKRRRFDVVVVWKLDRLGRNLKHLITLMDDWRALGIAFVSLGQGIDATTPAGKMHLYMVGMFAEYERDLIIERTKAGLARARAKGTRLGRPVATVPIDRLRAVAGLSHRAAARELGVSVSTVRRWRRGVQQTPLEREAVSPEIPRYTASA